ncbi:MAG TPA: K(+)-transporting ATPase subunit F [Thermoplasmata archaeon]|nr:K(+)-transporting ATPase subunit F [Thermoplasmata archaeon]
MDWLLAHLGLSLLTVLSIALIVYLVYVMIHPERF